MEKNTIEVAIEKLVSLYGDKEWFVEAKSTHESDTILLYVKYKPNDVILPATWKKIPLHIITRGKNAH